MSLLSIASRRRQRLCSPASLLTHQVITPSRTKYTVFPVLVRNSSDDDENTRHEQHRRNDRDTWHGKFDVIIDKRRQSHHGRRYMSALTFEPSKKAIHRVHHRFNLTRHQQREFHATQRREILPFLAAGFVGISIFYSYRALQQIDRDWEEYYDAVDEYRAKTGLDPEGAAYDGNDDGGSENGSRVPSNSHFGEEEELSKFFTGGTLGIDLGTTHLKLSHRAYQSQPQAARPAVSVDREGFRSTPSLLWMPSPKEDNDSDDGDLLLGRLAAARSHDRKGGVVINPREAFEGSSTMEQTKIVDAIRQFIRSTASNALDQALTASGSHSTSNQRNHPLFVLDPSMAAIPGSYNVRPVFTYPSAPSASAANIYLEKYKSTVADLTSPDGISAFVPEPVAIVTGAQYYDLLPKNPDPNASSVLVLDVGGISTQISMVSLSDKSVLYSSSIPLGGNTFVDSLVAHLIHTMYGPRNDSAPSSSQSSSGKPQLNDHNALQRLYEASLNAIHELSRKTRSQINIPYLTMDVSTMKPKHLNVGIARNVVEAEVNTWIRDHLIPSLATPDATSKDEAPTTAPLSKSLPEPDSLNTLISSMLMSALEQTSHTPHMLHAVLLVGGGARIPSIKEAVRQGLGFLAGEAYVSGEGKKLVIPEGEMGDELGVLGAAIWGSGGR